MCSICCDPFTNVVRVPIPCPYCDFQACTRCIKTYLLESLDDPHCMQCKTGWNQEFIDQCLSASFRKGELAKHRKEVMFGREKAKLPDTIEAANREKQKKALKAQVAQLTDRIRNLRAELAEAEQRRYQTHLSIDALDATGLTSERRQFVKACPAEGCRGFLSTQWKCQLCETRVCPDCHEIKDRDEHTCSPENLESVKMMARDTKPCPKCSALIHRIDGCDQMWCVCCKTAFSWRTLRIEMGHVHNPEYYRWMRESGQELPREPGDDAQCVDQQRLPSLLVIMRAMRDKGLWNERLGIILRALSHIQHVELHHALNGLNIDNPDPNRDLRIGYLLNEYSEERWKRCLLRRANRQERLNAARQAYEMIVFAGRDIVLRAVEATSAQEVDAAIAQLERLKVYFNECSAAIRARFGTRVVIELSPEWGIVLY